MLVHGAWHGGWVWRKVAPLLRSAGHRVLTPTLTGLGEREHLASPLVGLNTHVQDVVSCLNFEDAHEAILVGHAYGGMVATGAASQIPERVAQLVFLDAVVTRPGESLATLLGPSMIPLRELVDRAGDGWRLPWMGGMFGVARQEDMEWMEERLMAQPFATYTEPLLYTIALEDQPFGRTYVRFADPSRPDRLLDATAARLRNHPKWRYIKLAAPHAAMVTHPAELAALLLGFAPNS